MLQIKFSISFLFLPLDPDAVENLSVTAESFSSFRARWDSPTCPYGVISNYVLYYRQADVTQTPPIASNSVYEMVPVPSTETERVIDGLTPYTNYTLYVQAVVEGGLIGAIAVELRVRTLSTTAIPPPPGPVPIELSDPTSAQIVISIGDPTEIATGKVM